MVDFSSVPASTLVPFTWVEIADQALLVGPAIQPYKGLITGQMHTGFTATAGDPVLVTSAADAWGKFGPRSQLHQMAKAWFANNRSTELWAVPFAALVGTAALSVLDLTASVATAGGSLFLYVAGIRMPVPIAVGDTPTEIGAAAIVATPLDAPFVTTYNDTNKEITFTAANHGVFMNGVDVRLNYNRGETTPAGLVIVAIENFGATTAGAGSIDTDAIWTNAAATQFNVIALGEKASAELTKVRTELEDRWEPDRTLEGVAFYGMDDSISNLDTEAEASDSRFLVQVSIQSCPTPWFEFATAVAAVAAFGLSADPARPLQTLTLSGVLAPAETSRFTISNRETLLANGCATINPDAAGRMRIERIVTTYLTNAQSAADVSFRDIQTVATLSFMRYDLRTRFAAAFPRHKLAADGTVAGAGQAIVTPSIARAFLGGIGEDWAEILILENVKAWRDNLVVEINPSDPNRLDIRVLPNLVNQLRVSATRMEFQV